MPPVNVRDSTKDLISVDGEKGSGDLSANSAGSAANSSDGNMTTFNVSRVSHRFLTGALMASLALSAGLLVGLIVVSLKTDENILASVIQSTKSEGHSYTEVKVQTLTKDDLCLTEGCIGMYVLFL